MSILHALSLSLGMVAHAPLASPGTGYAPVNGLRIYYEVHGAPHGRTPLVLLHGGGSTIETSFHALLPALAKRRQVIAFEQQGHGHTADIPDRPFSFEQSADDAAALLRHLGISKADFLGYSNGGHIAIDIAIRHPELVRRLVVVSAMVKRDGADPAFWKGFEGAKLETMPEELRHAYLAVAPSPEQLPTFFQKSVTRMKQFRGWSDEQLRSILAPMLIIAGDSDVIRPEHAVEMFRLLPHARLAVLPGTDHMQMVERGGWLVPMIEPFLDAP